MQKLSFVSLSKYSRWSRERKRSIASMYGSQQQLKCHQSGNKNFHSTETFGLHFFKKTFYSCTLHVFTMLIILTILTTLTVSNNTNNTYNTNSINSTYGTYTTQSTYNTNSTNNTNNAYNTFVIFYNSTLSINRNTTLLIIVSWLTLFLTFGYHMLENTI